MLHLRVMDPQVAAKLEAMDKKLDTIGKSTRRTNQYMMWTFIITVVVFVLPLIGLAIVIPTFINQITSTYSNLNLKTLGY
jgi:hypothetical protein